MAAANTQDCFRELIGKRVVGMLFDALPGRSDLNRGTKTILLEDGTGLTISSHGTFWRESAADIKDALAIQRAELQKLKADLERTAETNGILEAIA